MVKHSTTKKHSYVQYDQQYSKILHNPFMKQLHGSYTAGWKCSLFSFSSFSSCGQQYNMLDLPNDVSRTGIQPLKDSSLPWPNSGSTWWHRRSGFLLSLLIQWSSGKGVASALHFLTFSPDWSSASAPWLVLGWYSLCSPVHGQPPCSCLRNKICTFDSFQYNSSRSSLLQSPYHFKDFLCLWRGQCLL